MGSGLQNFENSYYLMILLTQIIPLKNNANFASLTALALTDRSFRSFGGLTPLRAGMAFFVDFQELS